MVRRACGSGIPRPWLAVLALTSGLALGQDISVVRSPRDSNLSVRLENLASHVIYDRSGGTYFILPTGRYSVQLLRDGGVVYQEVEYIDPDSPDTRTVDPSGSGIMVGLSGGNPTFDPNPCSALQDASRLALANYGLDETEIQQRLTNAGPGANGDRCATTVDVDALSGTLAGSYGVTPIGMLLLSIEYTQLAPVRGVRHPVNPNLDTTFARPGISPAQQPGANLTASLVADLKNGISDVAVDVSGKPLLVCAAIDASTPLFCDSDGTVMAPNVNPHLAGLYRLRVRTSPVDHHGVEEDHWTAFFSEEEYHATQQKLARDMQTIQTNLLQRIGQVEAKSFTDANAGAPSARYYPAAELSLLIETTQTEIDTALHDVTLQPLRRAFPQPIAQLNPHSQDAVAASEAQRVFQQLKDTVALLEYVSGNLGVDLIFRTAPVETEGSSLTFEACDRCTPIVSQGGQHRFYRGRYYVKASLSGYVTYEGWLDLVADPKTTFECDMVRVHSAMNGRGSTCSLKPQ